MFWSLWMEVLPCPEPGSLWVSRAHDLKHPERKGVLLETRFTYPKRIRCSMEAKTHHSVVESARMKKMSLKFLKYGKEKLIFVTRWFANYFFLGRVCQLIRKFKWHWNSLRKFCSRNKWCWVVVVHTFNPSTCEAEAGGSLLVRASLVYKSKFQNT